ncbi:MAG: hypothetical protein ACK4HC_03845 [Cloacibacterium sp.]
MNTKFKKMVIATIIFAGLLSSCKKSESVDSQYESAVATADSTSVQMMKFLTLLLNKFQTKNL